MQEINRRHSPLLRIPLTPVTLAVIRQRRKVTRRSLITANGAGTNPVARLLI